jgi:hypothetical protein
MKNLSKKELASGLYLAFSFVLAGSLAEVPILGIIAVLANLIIAGLVFNKCVDRGTLDNEA